MSRKMKIKVRLKYYKKSLNYGNFYLTGEYVDEIDLYISEDYMQGTFDSCKNVFMPSTGRHSIELMGCSDWGASKCSKEKWFEFMGNVTAYESIPFQINYKPLKLTNQTASWKKPLNPSVIPCSQSIDVSLFE